MKYKWRRDKAIIICQNCGTTNNESTSRTCRKCGALLPISSKSKRYKKLEKADKPTTKKQSQKVDLQQIPEEKTLTLDEIPQENEQIVNNNSFSELSSESKQIIEEDEKQILQEITPEPFQSSILSTRTSNEPVSNAFSELKQSVLDEEKERPKPPLVPIPTNASETLEVASKQKKLEKDMSEVLSFLSKKVSVEKLASKVSESSPEKEAEKKIPPASMNEILNELITLDSRIEASAIIKTDGTMLASAISSRISESLFSTVGMNLSMIGEDIIHGLSAGTLKAISVKGTEGVLDLAPLDTESPNLKDMILILFSHPKVKSGIISIAINLIKKQIKYYMGLEK